MTPRVSVIIPCYRAADTLRRAAASALAGAPGDLELLLVDDEQALVRKYGYTIHDVFCVDCWLDLILDGRKTDS